MPPTTKKTSFSIDPELIKPAKARALEKGFRHSFSAYISELIRKDLAAGGCVPAKELEPAAQQNGNRKHSSGIRRSDKSTPN